MFSLKGKIALVTGASYGIGFAIAKAFANAGATIVFNDIKQELVDKGLKAYEDEGIKAHGYVCDVTDEDAVNALVATVEKEVGVIDILVNNAGIIKRIPMHEMSAKEFRQVIDVDLNAPFICSKAVIPSMVSRKQGRIINITSMWGIVGSSCEVHYSTAKAGLIGMTKALAKELGPSGITVNAIAPDVIQTEMNKALSDEDKQALCDETPLMRMGETGEIAEAALFLASEGASFITGDVMNVSGGFIM